VLVHRYKKLLNPPEDTRAGNEGFRDNHWRGEEFADGNDPGGSQVTPFKEQRSSLRIPFILCSRNEKVKGGVIRIKTRTKTARRVLRTV